MHWNVQTSKEWADSKTKHAADMESAHAKMRVQLDQLGAASESSRAETKQLAGEILVQQREIDKLGSHIAYLEEAKEKHDEEMSLLHAQAVSAQARIKMFEHRADAHVADAKMVGELKVVRSVAACCTWWSL